MSDQPDPTKDWWITKDVAAYLGVKMGTVSSYRKREQMPPPDQTVGRTHMWRPKTIMRWRPMAMERVVGDDPKTLAYLARATAMRDALDGARIVYEISFPGTDVEACWIPREGRGGLMVGPTQALDEGYDLAGYAPGGARTFWTRRPDVAEALKLIEENR